MHRVHKMHTENGANLALTCSAAMIYAKHRRNKFIMTYACMLARRPKAGLPIVRFANDQTNNGWSVLRPSARAVVPRIHCGRRLADGLS
jgi:hypothetical protein